MKDRFKEEGVEARRRRVGWGVGGSHIYGICQAGEQVIFKCSRRTACSAPQLEEILCLVT